MATRKHSPQKATRAQIILFAGLAAALITVILALCLGGNGPVKQLKSAAAKTFLAKNFTAMFELDVEGSTTAGLINAAIDPEARKLDVYMELNTLSDDYICGIYEGTFLVYDTHNNVQTVDISPRINAFFDVLVEKDTTDWSLLLNADGLDLHSVIGQHFDFELLLDSLATWLDTLNQADWAEANAGYQKYREDGVTKHSFTPDPYVLLTQSLPIFEYTFLHKTDYSNLLTYTDNAKFLLKDGKLDLIFGVKGGKLVSCDLDLQYHNTEIHGTCSFIGIGSTIVDTDTIAYYINSAKEGLDNPFEEFFTE